MESKVLVPFGSKDEFRSRLDALSSRARKYGLPDIEVIDERIVMYRPVEHIMGGGTDGPRIREMVPARKDDDGGYPDDSVPLREIRISHPALVRAPGGWSLVGMAEKAGEELVLYPFDPDLEQEMTRFADESGGELRCDHCRTNRLRDKVFIVRNEGGECRMVGSTCLEDYTGISPSSALFLANLFQVLSETEDEFARGHGVHVVEPAKFLADVLFVVKHDSFVSSSRARETGEYPTWSAAAQIGKWMGDSADLAREYRETREARRGEARRIIEEVLPRLAEADPDNLFLRNAKILAGQDLIESTPRVLATIAGIVPSVRRYDEARNEAPGYSARHVGAPGEKIRAEITCVGVNVFDGYYGKTWYMRFRDAEGNRYLWKTSSPGSMLKSRGGPSLSRFLDPEGLVRLGAWFDAEFKIKGHEEWKGVPENHVVRLKAVDAVRLALLLSIQQGNTDSLRTEIGDPEKWREMLSALVEDDPLHADCLRGSLLTALECADDPDSESWADLARDMEILAGHDAVGAARMVARARIDALDAVEHDDPDRIEAVRQALAGFPGLEIMSRPSIALRGVINDLYFHDSASARHRFADLYNGMRGKEDKDRQEEHGRPPDPGARP